MNIITRTLLSLLLVSSTIGRFTIAMQRIATGEKMSKSQLIGEIKELPYELRQYIIFLLLQNSICFDFVLYRTLDLECEATRVKLSPDGSICAIGLKGKGARIWNVKTGECITRFTRDTDTISSIAFSSKGEKCLTGTLENIACVWNTKTSELITTFTGHKGIISSVTFSPDDQLCLTGSYDKTACIWNSNTGELLTTLIEYTENISSVAFSPDGKNVLTGSKEGRACVWNSKTGELVTTFTRHRSGIKSVAFSPDGESCLTGSSDCMACVWSSTTAKLLKTFMKQKNACMSVDFDLDKKDCLQGSLEHIMYVWNPKTVKLVKAFKGQGNNLSSLAFSPDNSFKNTIISVGFSLDGENCIIGSLDYSVSVWNFKTSELIKFFAGQEDSTQLDLTQRDCIPFGFSQRNIIYPIAFSSDGESIISGAANKKAHIWKILYDFNYLTKEKKEIAFKQFITLYPLLQRTNEPFTDETDSST